MLKLINGVLGAVCFVILGSDMLAAAQDLQLRHSFGAPPGDRIGLGEAVSIAETRLDGRALDAKLVDFAGYDEWDIDVSSHGGRVQVWIDARSGVVSSTR